ncbi:hypothetical protein HMPREF9093_02278 [Fusobacterium sp. oral taxon 370 str. F0437]|nr:hypothetical protein HMPREF9093_02278 [Fusobacterium sp. oral taxon 370 str. F0437]
MVRNSEKILENTNNNLEKINILVEDVTDILKASKRNIVNTSSSVSTTLENIKNVSNDVAESSRFIAHNFIGKNTETNKNASSFIAVVDTILDCWDILKLIFKKK